MCHLFLIIQNNKMKKYTGLKQLLAIVAVASLVFFAFLTEGYSQCAAETNNTSPYCGTTCYDASNPGLWTCLTSTIPSAYSCSSCTGVVGASCMWLHIRNRIDCDQSGGVGIIDKVTIKFRKDTNGSKFQICSPYTNWGDPTYTTMWTIIDSTGSGATLTSGNCYSWDASTSRTIEFNPPTGSNYLVSCGKHFMVTICGGAGIAYVRVHYADGNAFEFPVSLSNTNCIPICQ